MPYVYFSQRQALDPHIDALCAALQALPDTERGGAFDYALFCLLRRLTDGQRYHVQRGFVGDVVWSLLEWYRRFAVPYEDQARMRNGDII